MYIRIIEVLRYVNVEEIKKKKCYKIKDPNGLKFNYYRLLHLQFNVQTRKTFAKSSLQSVLQSH